MATVIFCKATDEFQAESIVYELKASGFPESAISILAPSSAEEGQKSEDILISVHSESDQETEEAKEIFQNAEAEDISVAAEEEVRR